MEVPADMTTKSSLMLAVQSRAGRVSHPTRATAALHQEGFRYCPARRHPLDTACQTGKDNTRMDEHTDHA